MTMTLNPNRMPASSLRSVISKSLVASGLLAALVAVPSFADEAADVTRLMHSGQQAAALSRVNAYLANNPRDAQMRFLKGVILTEQNKSADAIAIFTRLTEDYPTLPEPYNNLAVLYAAEGKFDKAQAALDAAIRTNPSYATAYENLGDVHARLASQAYDKALQLDSANSTAKSKLTLLRSLVGSMKPLASNAAAPAVAPATAKTVGPAPAAPKLALAAPAAPPPVAAKPAAPAPVAAVAQPKPAPAQAKAEPVRTATATATARTEPKSEPHPAAKQDDGRDDVLAAVNGWAKAWSARDVKGYLDHYSSDFQTPPRMSHKAWAEQRRARIVDKSHISVKVESPQVKVSGDRATVKFQQIYDSDRLSAKSRKTLVLEKHGGQWLIQQENTGS